MLSPHQLEQALQAVTAISVDNLLIISTKMLKDLESGRYGDAYEITSSIKVGDLRKRKDWWKDTYVMATLVSAFAGNLIRIACKAVNVDPMNADWRQMITIVTATSHIEVVVVGMLMKEAEAAA